MESGHARLVALLFIIYKAWIGLDEALFGLDVESYYPNGNVGRKNAAHSSISLNLHLKCDR